MTITFLYLSRTLEYIATCLETDWNMHERPPKEVTSEIASLFDFWDSWTPTKYLNLSKAKLVPHFAPDIQMDELVKMCMQTNIAMPSCMCFVIAHEFGHLLKALDHTFCTSESIKEASHLLRIALLDTQVRDLVVDVVLLERIIEPGEMHHKWADEISSDFVAFEWCKSIPGIRELDALVLLITMQWLVEYYLSCRKGAVSFSHPWAPIRSQAIAEYATSHSDGASQDYKGVMLKINLIMKALLSTL